MAARLTAYTHQMQFIDHDSTYSVLTSLGGGHDLFEISTDKAALCSLRHTSSTLTISGSDERGRAFTLTLTPEGSEVHGELSVAGRLFQRKDTSANVMSELIAETEKTPDIQKSLPKSLALSKLADDVRQSRQMVSFLVGYPKPTKAAPTGGYCNAVCKCCEKGTWLSAWCCISCASCDYFKNPLQNVVNAILLA